MEVRRSGRGKDSKKAYHNLNEMVIGKTKYLIFYYFY